MNIGKYDSLLLNILEDCGHLEPFIDVIFDFLNRRTDFFEVNTKGRSIGFPAGHTKKVVLKILRKYHSLSDQSVPISNYPMDLDNTPYDDPPVVREEIVVASPLDSDLINSKKENISNESDKLDNIFEATDTYNGADRGAYRWSQTSMEVEVLVPVPPHIKKSRDVNIIMTDKILSVKVKDASDSSKWNTLVDGNLTYKINRDESLWSLSPGQQIMIQYEKRDGRWWDSVLTNEPKLDMKKIDATKPMSELNQEEQMKIEELICNEERKQKGLKTNEQLKAEKILKDAWNMEGSPFKGTVYDPTILDFHTNPTNNMQF